MELNVLLSTLLFSFFECVCVPEGIYICVCPTRVQEPAEVGRTEEDVTSCGTDLRAVVSHRGDGGNRN